MAKKIELKSDFGVDDSNLQSLLANQQEIDLESPNWQNSETIKRLLITPN